MSVRNPDGYRANLARPFRANEIEMPLRRADAIALNVIGVGNHAYLTLRDRVKTEVVRYDHIADWDATDPSVVGVPVVRDMAGLGARSFAFGTCVTAELTSFFLRDLVDEMGNALPCDPVASCPTTETPALPTTVIGPRTALLGEPSGFVELCPGKKVPYYSGC